MCACHSPVYHYYCCLLAQSIIPACVVVLWSQRLSLKDKASARTLGGLDVDEYSLKEQFDVQYLHARGIISVWCIWCRQTSSCLLGVLYSMPMWATAGHHHIFVNYYSILPATFCRSFDVQSRSSWSCLRVPYHALERRCACLFSHDILSFVLDIIW